VPDVVDDPQFAALEMLQTCEGSGLSLLGAPLSFDGVRGSFRTPPPALGADTQAVLGPGETAG